MSRDCEPKGLTWNACAHFHAFHLQTLHTFGDRLLNREANAALQVRSQQQEEDSLSAAHVRGRGSDKHVPGNVGGEGSDIITQVLIPDFKATL